MRAVLGVLAILILLCLGGLAWLYSGAYPVAATQAHSSLVRWVLETAKRQSVRTHARGTAVPPLGDPDLVREGARLFGAHCALCHGAPGTEPQGFALTMNPMPPILTDAVRHWTSAELYWITLHGLRMTGMPAWGATHLGEHDDDPIWALVAFMSQLPTMQAERYRSFVAPVPESKEAAPAQDR